MNYTDPKTWIDHRTAHAIGGQLLVLLFHHVIPGLWVLIVPALVAILRETYQAFKDPEQTFPKAYSGFAQWFTGGCIGWVLL